MRALQVGLLAAVFLGCGGSRGAVVVGGSGSYGSAYDDGYGYPGSYDVDAYAVGLQTPTLSVFYQELSPYGRWVHHPSYGQVFIPADRDYVPYQNGQWVYTDAGWYWQSDEPIGWAVNHYGRWDLDASYGWLWVPGTQWAPAWVDWRSSGDLVGWAPLAPTRTRFVEAPERRFHFVHRDHLTRRDVGNYVRRFDRDYVRYRTAPISRPTTTAPVRPIPRHELQRVRGFDRSEPRRVEPRYVEPQRQVAPPRYVPPARQVAPPRYVAPPSQAEPPRAVPPRQAVPPRYVAPPSQVEHPRVPPRRVAPPPPARDDDRDRGRGRGRDKDRDRDDRDRDDDRPKKRHR